MKKFLVLVLFLNFYFVVNSQTLKEACVAVIKNDQACLQVYDGIQKSFNRGFENQSINLEGKKVFAGSKALDDAFPFMVKHMLKVLEDVESTYNLKIPDKLLYSYTCVLSYIADIADQGIPILVVTVPVKRPIQDHIKLLSGTLEQKIKMFSEELNDSSIVWSFPSFISKSYDDMIKELRATFK